MSETKGLI